MEDLTEKQKEVYDTLIGFYGQAKIDEREADIISKIRNFPEIDYYKDPRELKEIFNDVVFDSNLFKRCIVPPFSVLDTRGGEWKTRRAQLDAYLGSSVAGRKDGLTYGMKIDYFGKGGGAINNNTSQFDSLLSEIIYKWFGFPKCKVYDSFAGGHIRGTMAKILGYDYFGIELNEQQVKANEERFYALRLGDSVWKHDDSLNVDNYLQDNSIDLFFTCPPYGDLEKYTDDPRDLSNMNYEDFKDTYFEIIKKGCKKLKDDRFAVFVVGDFRDSKGFYRGFVKDTIQAFKDAEIGLYNEIILINQVGSGSLRAGGAFINRKMTKTHQNVLVFYKGDVSKIKENYPEIDSSLPIKQFEQKGLF